MLVKRFGYAVALTTTSLIAILVSSWVFPDGKVDARPCGSDPLSRLGCTLDPTNPTDNDGSGRRYPKYFHVKIHNKTNIQIWVAVNYRENPPIANNKGSDSQVAQVMTEPSYQWKKRGYWNLAPGQKVLILNDEDRISNRIIYFHAHNDDQTRVWGKNDNVFEVRGKNQPFFKADMGETIGEYTQSFTAN